MEMFVDSDNVQEGDEVLGVLWWTKRGGYEWEDRQDHQGTVVATPRMSRLDQFQSVEVEYLDYHGNLYLVPGKEYLLIEVDD